MLKPEIFQGGISFDKRGSVSYNNSLKIKKVKRFYIVQNKKIKRNLCAQQKAEKSKQSTARNKQQHNNTHHSQSRSQPVRTKQNKK